MSCKDCEYSPKTYEEYCIGQSCPSVFCPDAYTEKAQYCGNYDKSNTESEAVIDVRTKADRWRHQ